ncbi:hypothetical protein TNCV_3935521 [Trichonephila clavipes]|nr:hypothetical protein TNCV_3935521 [Trichonephila clavipes]
MDECARRTSAVSNEVQAADRRATKFVCVVTSSRYTSSSSLAHRGKIPTVEICQARATGHRQRSFEPQLGDEKDSRALYTLLVRANRRTLSYDRVSRHQLLYTVGL